MADLRILKRVVGFFFRPGLTLRCSRRSLGPSVVAATLTFAVHIHPASAAPSEVQHIASRAELLQIQADFGPSDFQSWLGNETQISMQKLLANISPSGAALGAVIASPSRKDPDYFAFWVRDAALVMDLVFRNFAASTGANRAAWKKLLNDYVDFSRVNQTSPTQKGLGEPKFYADGRVFNDPWGRPQNDGPALRVLTLSKFALTLLKDGETDYVAKKLYSAELPAHTVIKADLEYVAHHWRDKSFDLWEEVRGDHFYTRFVQLSALNWGVFLAEQLGDSGAAGFYRSEMQAIQSDIGNFWDPSRGILVATRGRDEGLATKSSGLDSAIILGVLHAGFTEGEFSPTDDRVLATAQRLEESMQKIYAINQPGRFPGVAPAIGRYPEDTYSGQPGIPNGNPWVLTTAALAELHYRAATEIRAAGLFTLNAVNASFISSATEGFFDPLIEEVMSGRLNSVTLNSSQPEFQMLITKLVDRGDAFMARIRIHAAADGSLAEQIDRNSGYMCSARDLTWSYASLITAAWARP